MFRAFPLVLVLIFAPWVAFAQTIISDGKPTSKVIERFEKLVATGAFLTPEGWNKAANLYAESLPYPATSEIFVTTIGGGLGRTGTTASTRK